MGEDPVRTDPDTNHVIKALEALDFLVVDDLFLTETAKFADVVLPGRSYAEKEGTFSNTERRVQRIRTAVTIPGTRLDTDIFIDLMNRMGYDQPRLTSAQIMDEIAELTQASMALATNVLTRKKLQVGVCSGLASTRTIQVRRLCTGRLYSRFGRLLTG